MSNRRKIASIAFTGAAATAATMMGATPTFATSTFHIKNGVGGYTGTIKGKLKAGTTAALSDTTTHNVVPCKKAVLSGTVSKSSGTTPATVGKLKATVTNWSSCTTVFGTNYKMHLTTSPNVVISKVTSTGATGKLTGNKISGHISGTGLNLCQATVSGTSIPVKYVNAGHSLIINSGHVATLKFKSATLCSGRFNANDKFYFAGTYAISTPANLTIS